MHLPEGMPLYSDSALTGCFCVGAVDIAIGGTLPAAVPNELRALVAVPAGCRPR